MVLIVFINLQFIFSRYLIQFSKNDPNDVTWKEDWKGYVLAAGFFVTVLMQSFFFHQLFYWSVALGLRIRACLVSAVYKKVGQTVMSIGIHVYQGWIQEFLKLICFQGVGFFFFSKLVYQERPDSWV